jgi:hypothetical protein
MADKIRIIILLLLLGCFCCIRGAEAGESRAAASKKEQGYVVMYYFHGNYRCSSCRTIEQYSREAIEDNFPYQLETKKLVFKTINVDLPENQHFIQDYQLYTRSLVIAEFRDRKQIAWKNLPKVWEYLNDRSKFYEYVRSEIQKSLEKM